MAKPQVQKVMKNKPLVKSSRKRQKKYVSSGIVYINATFNNTIVSITDPSGNLLAWASAGSCKFSGSKKSSSFAASVAAQEAAKAAVQLGMKEVEVNIKGPGAGRESAARSIISSALNVTMITDTTPIPFNGCRARKRRRP